VPFRPLDQVQLLFALRFFQVFLGFCSVDVGGGVLLGVDVDGIVIVFLSRE